MSSSATDLADVRVIAEHVADTLTEISGHRVAVTAVSLFDDSEQQAQGSELLGIALEKEPGYLEVAVDLRIDSEAVRVFVNAAQHRAQLTEQLANSIADSGQEVLGSEPFPPCPGHAHPLAVMQREGRTFWCCPRDPKRVLAVLFEG